MANCGKKDTNSSQFYITMTECDWLDDECVIFGELVKGADVVRSISDYSVMTAETEDFTATTKFEGLTEGYDPDNSDLVEYKAVKI